MTTAKVNVQVIHTYQVRVEIPEDTPIDFNNIDQLEGYVIDKVYGMSSLEIKEGKLVAVHTDYAEVMEYEN